MSKSTLIIYNSSTGFTEKYADMLKSELGAAAQTVPLKKFKPKMLKDFDRAVFMAHVYSNAIDGFKTVVKHAELFASKYACVVAVGMAADTAAHYHALEQANVPYKLKGIPLFFARGGFDAEKLTGKSKFMIKLMKMQLKGAASRSPEEMAMLNFLEAKSDKCDAKYLKPVLEYLETGVFTPPEKEEEYADNPYWVDLTEFMPKFSGVDFEPAQSSAAGRENSVEEGGADSAAEPREDAFSGGSMKE